MSNVPFRQEPLRSVVAVCLRESSHNLLEKTLLWNVFMVIEELPL